MTTHIGAGNDAGNGTSSGDGGGNVTPFPSTAEERRQRRQAIQERERRRLINVFIDEAGHQLFCAPDGTAYADLIIDGHRETWPVKSQQFRFAYLQYLNRELERVFASGEPPSIEAVVRAMTIKATMRKSAVNAAIEDYANLANFGKVKRSVHVRVAGHGDEIFLDLCNDSWEAVRITAASSSIVEAPPVRFVRTEGMLPLPYPKRGGNVEALQSFVNLKTAADLHVYVGYLLAALRPRGPYPIFSALGPPGAAKTRLLRLARRLVDPHLAETTAPPASGEELFIAGRNSHLQAFENVRSLTPLMSDHWCRMATGGSYRGRRRFTNTRENLHRGGRPIMYEGIHNVAKEPDFLDRLVVIEVERVPDEELDRMFEDARPAIFGGLIDMLVCGLRNRSTARLAGPAPRMAGFALWGVACGVPDFEAAYAANRQAAINALLEYDPVARAVHLLMGRRKRWRGTAMKLLEA